MEFRLINVKKLGFRIYQCEKLGFRNYQSKKNWDLELSMWKTGL